MILALLLGVWILSWIVSGKYFKRKNQSQPYGRGFLFGMFLTCISIYGYQYFFPSKEELLKQAEQAENQYFLLSGASLDHERICDAAIKAFKLHQRAGNEERAKLIQYGIIQDKCL